jgi:HEAT repeat protein
MLSSLRTALGLGLKIICLCVLSYNLSASVAAAQETDKRQEGKSKPSARLDVVTVSEPTLAAKDVSSAAAQEREWDITSDPCKGEQPGNVLGISEQADVPGRVTAFVRKLSDEDPKTRSCAARQLGYLGPQATEATPFLIKMFHDEKHQGVETNVTKALWDIGPDRKSDVQEWLVLIKDEDKYIRLYAAFALGYYKPLVLRKEIVQALTAATHDDDVTVARMAVRGLTRLGPIARTAVPRLIEILKAKDNPLGAEALYALGRIGPDAIGAVPEMLRILYLTKNYSVYLNAAMGLGNIGPRILPLLESEFKSHPFQILEVVQYLGAAGTPLIVEALKTKDNELRKQAMKVLRSLGPDAESAVPALIKGLEDRDAEMRQEAARALKSIGPRAEAAVPGLTLRLNDKDALVQCWSADALGSIGSAAKPAIPNLQRLMNLKTEGRVDIPHICAAEALLRMGHEAAALVPPEMIKRLEEHAEMMNKLSLFEPDDPTQPAKPKPKTKPSRTY